MKAVSLYSGAGGLDCGLLKAGFEVVFANDYNKDACNTYKANLGDHVQCGDIKSHLGELSGLKGGIDLLAGGPPCQGFSVAGKMNPDDARSKHVWTFVDAVSMIQPSAFIMENVKALGALKRWAPLREELLKAFRRLGYATNYIVLNASDYDVPQSRERVFFIGFKLNSVLIPDLEQMMLPYQKKAPTVKEVLSILDRAGTGNNSGLSMAKITLTANPVMRKSPYAGMLFNGAGRPVRLNGYSPTLPASMGGNKTPIIDEEELYENKPSWVEAYHAALKAGEKLERFFEVPKRLRRLTYQEAALLQTFPADYTWKGSKSSVFKQIGNAVPCNLGYRLGKMVMDCLLQEEVEKLLISLPVQLELNNGHFD